ncbi:molecular chaperone DnaK [Burkholderia multivorans]|uniref:Molecular chaperone DnaK n=1 Tax=Burkholderia multivorans TaxID=87883 RepID=A0AB37B249_9BURK|nr:molecular chaperone DnaK [Burkholderia multivorans]PRE55967.1 molecular chaperone DnaK [Burkholderia multivorans]
MTVDLKPFRDRIEADLTRLEAAIEEIQRSAAPVTLDQSSVGRLSRMDALQQQAMAQGTLGRLRVSRRRLLAAIERIETGVFGRCCQCDDAIESDRLEADPGTVFCLECAAERGAGDGR